MAYDPDAQPRTINVPGEGTQTLSYTLPPGVILKLESILASVTGAAGTEKPLLTIQAPGGAVIAAKRQANAIDAGSGNRATWALRLDDEQAASSNGGGGGVPTIATFYRDSVFVGDPALSVGAGLDQVIGWLHAELPSDGLITGPTGFANHIVTFARPCFVLMALYTRWESGNYRRSGWINDNPARMGEAWDVTLSFASDGTNSLSATGASNIATSDVRPAAYIANDTIWCYAGNGDAATRTVRSAILSVYAWEADTYAGGVPAWPA